MKKKKALFEEDVSREFRQRVFAGARQEFAETFPPNLGLRNFLKGGLTAAGLMGLTWWSARQVPEVSNEDVEQLALLDTDIELLENLDWLDDLELLEETEELDEWPKS